MEAFDKFTTGDKAIFAPCAVLALWHLGLFGLLGIARASASIKNPRLGKYYEKYKEDEKKNIPSEPVWISLIAHNIENFSESPPLFYICIILNALMNNHVNNAFLINLAWVYVAARVFHSIIHCTINSVPPRFFSFVVSIVVLGIMWFKTLAFITA